MNKICYGCGSKLQSNDPLKEGYIPENKADSSYCQRCYRLIHYGEFRESNAPKSINSILNNINKNASFVLFITDFLSINKDILDIYQKINKDKILLINKSDIIPRSVRFERIIDYLKKDYQIDNAKIISSHTGYGINELINYLYYHKINEVYILGESNAGKSSLINKMIELTDSPLNKITTSQMKNTTLDFIRIKLNNNLTVIDSPGFIIDNEINGNPSEKEISPKIYQIKQNEILKIGDYYLKFSDYTNIVLYLNQNLDIKKYYKEINFTEDISINNDEDLVIKGLGFINVKSKCQIFIAGLDKEYLEIRKSIFGRNHE